MLPRRLDGRCGDDLAVVVESLCSILPRRLLVREEAFLPGEDDTFPTSSLPLPTVVLPTVVAVPSEWTDLLEVVSGCCDCFWLPLLSVSLNSIGTLALPPCLSMSLTFLESDVSLRLAVKSCPSLSGLVVLSSLDWRCGGVSRGMGLGTLGGSVFVGAEALEVFALPFCGTRCGCSKLFLRRMGSGLGRNMGTAFGGDGGGNGGGLSDSCAFTESFTDCLARS